MGKLLPQNPREWVTGHPLAQRYDPIAKKDPLMGSLFGSKPQAPAPAPPPAVMPSPMLDDEEVRMARKRAIEAAQQRGGRASTILTDKAEDKLG